MAGMAVLEREIEKQTKEREATVDRSVTSAEQEHRRMMSENMKKLLNPEEDTRFDRYTPPANPQVRTYDFDETLSARAPAYQNPMATAELHTPVVPNSPDAPSAARRIADYVPVKVGMQSVQRFADMDVRTAPRDYAPAPEAPAREAGKGLFEDLLYKDGELVSTASAATEAPARSYVSAPAYRPIEEPAFDPSYQEEEEDDALPTRRTLDTIRRGEEAENEAHAGFFSALSMKTKLVLAAVAAVIVVLLAAICVNTAILNSLDEATASMQRERDAVVSELGSINDRIDELTSPDYIEQWVADHPEYNLTAPNP